MIVVKLIRLCLIGALIPLPLLAQQQVKPPLDLSALLMKVNEHAPSLMVDESAIRIKEAQEEASRFNWLPSLKLNYQADIGTNNNLPGGYFANGIVPGNSRVREEENTSTILTDLGIAAFDWEIYNFGKYNAQRNVAKSETALEKARYEQAKFELQVLALNGYLQLIRLLEQRTIQLQNIARNVEIRRSIQSLAVSGVKAGVDTSIAEAELSRSRLDLMELDNQAKKLQLQLSSITGMQPADIMPDTTLPGKMYSKFILPMINDNDTIIENHPLLQVYKSLETNSQYREEQVRKNYNPKLMLQAAYWGRGSSVSAKDEFRSLSKGFGFERSNYLVGLGLTFNIFDLKRRQLEVSIQQQQTYYAKKKIEEQQVALTMLNDQADVELETARERLMEMPHQLDAANAAYRQKFSLYKNGLTNIVELNAAQTMLYRAETSYTNARYAYCKAMFQKAFATNQLQALINLLK
ncbi:outer membrane protein TolC [Chitinophaga skermanii]|uniref:Outer membrane protein TolC n=1 Tax=Chitinophaga skermanii TaxID=331697 RepID=A0A327R2F9_9BACT|nr:TolC family protein [Chitinophaga skermanii]RAJ10860.1 outer membrane protein TolC [Chitinophaga skermanii]